MSALAIKLCGLVLILSLLVFGGCRWQHRLDEGKIAAAKQTASGLRDELRKAAGALSIASGQFLAIDATTKANEEAAARAKQAAEGAAKDARKDAATFQRKLLDLERRAEKDRASCPAGQMRICGEPLQ